LLTISWPLSSARCLVRKLPIIANHADQLMVREQNYGQNQKPAGFT
jgi:hypothetical protein